MVVWVQRSCVCSWDSSLAVLFVSRRSLTFNKLHGLARRMISHTCRLEHNSITVNLCHFAWVWCGIEVNFKLLGIYFDHGLCVTYLKCTCTTHWHFLSVTYPRLLVLIFAYWMHNLFQKILIKIIFNRTENIAWLFNNERHSRKWVWDELTVSR